MNVSESSESDALPLVDNSAPRGVNAFAHPRPAMPGVPHGQSAPVPSPAQYVTPALPRLRRTTIWSSLFPVV